MIGVNARGGVDVRAVVAAVIGIRIGVKLAIPTGGTHAVVINRRVQNLLLKAGEPHVRQPFDLTKIAIDARRGQRVETPVVPVFIRLDERTRLWIFRVITFAKIVHHERIGLVIDERLEIKIRRRCVHPSEFQNLTVFGNATVLRKSVRARVRLLVIQIIILQAELSPVAEMQIHVRPQTDATFRAIVRVDFSVRICAGEPVVSAQ